MVAAYHEKGRWFMNYFIHWSKLFASEKGLWWENYFKSNSFSCLWKPLHKIDKHNKNKVFFLSSQPSWKRLVLKIGYGDDSRSYRRHFLDLIVGKGQVLTCELVKIFRGLFLAKVRKKLQKHRPNGPVLSGEPIGRIRLVLCCEKNAPTRVGISAFVGITLQSVLAVCMSLSTYRDKEEPKIHLQLVTFVNLITKLNVVL